jgi:hypothetical protein
MSRETAEKIEDMTRFPGGLTELPEKVYKDKLGEIRKKFESEDDPKFSEEKGKLDDWMKDIAREATEKVNKYRQFESATCLSGEQKVLRHLFNLCVVNGKDWLATIADRDAWPSSERIVELQKKYGTPIINNVGFCNKLGGHDEIELFRCFLKPLGME